MPCHQVIPAGETVQYPACRLETWKIVFAAETSAIHAANKRNRVQLEQPHLDQRNPYLRNFCLPLLGYSLLTKSEVDDPPAQADGDRLGSVAGAQFIHDVFDMDLDCFFGNEELSRDVAIAVSSSNLAENLHLPLR